MKRIEARIKTSFGEIVIEGETPEEILGMLETMPENFIEKLSDFVSNMMMPSWDNIERRGGVGRG